MLRLTVSLRKNPAIPRYGKGSFTDQLKRILQKETVHKMVWKPISMYEPRRLWHADRKVDPVTGQEDLQDAEWENDTYRVPDQQFGMVPVPARYQDAYWTREAESKRVQVPISSVTHRFTNPRLRVRTDFQDLSFKPKKFYSYDDVIAHAKTSRR